VAVPVSLLLTGGLGEVVRLRDWTADRLLREWRNPCPMWRVALSPDGKTAATAGLDRFVRLWDAATGQPKGLPLPHQMEGIRDLKFSPDGRTLLSCSYDQTVRLWDVATGKPLGPPLLHPHMVKLVAISPDGRRLATGCDDGRVRTAELPRPVAGDVGRVRLWVEVLTGLELDTAGAVRELDPDALRPRQEQLQRLGGPPVAVVPPPAAPPGLPEPARGHRPPGSRQ
jgi:hypothetical protein